MRGLCRLSPRPLSSSFPGAHCQVAAGQKLSAVLLVTNSLPSQLSIAVPEDGRETKTVEVNRMDKLSQSLSNRFNQTSITWQNVLVVVGVYIVVDFVVRSVVSYRRLSAFKGPFFASISQLWLAAKTFKGGLNIEFAKVIDQYGKC